MSEEDKAAASRVTVTIDNLPPGIARVTRVDLSESIPTLELQANIGGQVHRFALPLDAKTLIELSGREVAAEFEAIRHLLKMIKDDQNKHGDALIALGKLIAGRRRGTG